MVSLEDDLGPDSNVRRWGLFDDENGLFFEQSNGYIHTVVRRSSTDAKVGAIKWMSRFTPSLGAQSQYEIRVTRDGADTVLYQFSVNGDLVNERRHHSSEHIPIELPISVENDSTGGTADVGLVIGEVAAGRYGAVSVDSRRSYDLANTTAQVKNKCGHLHRVIIGVPGASGDTVTFYNGTSDSDESLLSIDISLMREVECGFAFDQLYAKFSTGATGDVVVVFD